MSENGGLPEAVRAVVEQHLTDTEHILVGAHADLAPDGTYGDQWVVLTDRRLLRLTPPETPDGNGDRPTITLEVELDDVKGAAADSQVGRGILQVTIGGEPHDVVAFTNTEASRFSKLARAIDDWARNEKPIDPERILADDDEKRVCQRCGRVLPPWSSNCPACVHKGRVLLRLFTYLKPYWYLSLVGLVLALGGTSLELVPPLLTKTLVDDVLTVNPDRPPTPLAGRLHLLALLVLGLLAVRVVGTALGVAHSYLMVWLGGRVTFDVRAQLYHTMQHLALKFFDAKETGGLLSRITRDTDNLQGMVVDGTEVLLRDGLMVLGIGGFLFYLQPTLAAYVLLPAPLIAIAMSIFWQRIRRAYHRVWHRWSRLSARVGESISGVRVVKAFAQEGREVGRFRRSSWELFRAMLHAERFWAVFFPLIGFALAATTLLVWWIGGKAVVNHTGFTLGGLMAFLAYIGMFYRPLQSLSNVSSQMQRAFTAAERVFEVLDSEPEGSADAEATAMPHIEGRVEFRDVTFGYKPAHPVLRNIDVDVAAGEMLGLVGHSGAGKSTLINLICRFYDTQEGAILIDGVDVKQMRLRDLRSQIGVVLQEPFLFNGSIADNIAYGKPGATPEEVIQAARAANAHEFVVRLPDGYDTICGERGERLSGGERQRISIARAILHDPAILILDEATASVDTETEQRIQQAIFRLVTERTTFAIAHRLSTLRHANRLLVLEGGQTAELGTHDELLAKQGTYWRLVQMQAEVSKVRVVDG